MSVPLVWPSLEGEFWAKKYSFYFDAPLLALTVLALWSARRAATTALAKRFWLFLAIGHGFWLTLRIVDPLLTGDPRTAMLFIDVLYLAFYLFLVLALDLRPHRRRDDPSESLTRHLESSGATVFCFGLLIYFVVIPAAYDPTSFATYIPSTTLFVVLNLYLFWRALTLWRSWRHEPWRGSYGWILLATLGFVLLDGFDLLTRMEVRINQMLGGTLIESLWLLPTLGFVAAARIYALGPDESAETGPRNGLDVLLWKRRGRMTYFALSPAVLHILVEAFGSDDASMPVRRTFVLVWVAIAVGIGVLYDRRLLQQQRAIERSHREVREQLEVAQRMDAVRRMAGGIAHDFNNLLLVIQGFAEVLASKLKHTEDAEDARQISKAAARAGALTRKLMVLATREKAGRESFSPSAAVAEMAPMLERLVGEDKYLELALEDAGFVLGDRAAFEDALMNLVLNARAASRSGDTITVRTGGLRVREDGQRVPTLAPGSYGFVAVEDRGVGMDEETRSHVFEPFFTTRPDGSGLGLSMVYTFAREAGGTVDLDSELGRGSVFRIVLPQSPPPQDASQESADRRAPAPHRTALLVDDEDSVRHVLKRSLEAAGIRVLEAGDGESALRLLEDHLDVIDIIITDVVMPKLDGGRLALRAHAIAPEIPVLFMTGYAAGQLENLGPLLETAPVLTKPFAGAELLREVERVLEGDSDAVH